MKAAATEADLARFDPAVEPTIEWVQRGDGAAVKAGDVVETHFELSLADGRVLDSSRTRDRPFAFPAGRWKVVPGWDAVVLRMRVGDRVRALLPAAIAYGRAGVEGVVPPDSDLKLDLEVLSIVPEPSWDVIASGTGPPLQPGQMVLVHFVSTFADGRLIESSRKDDKPFGFRLGAGDVVPGWDKVVARMRVGDRWSVRIPWYHAHGAGGLPPAVPPRSDLVVDIEVLGAQ